MEFEETLTEFNKRWRMFVLRHQATLPALFDDEVKRNNYKLLGRAYRNYRG